MKTKEVRKVAQSDAKNAVGQWAALAEAMISTDTDEG
jgi:hypothetical protein